jgi:hypothetical protein
LFSPKEVTCVKERAKTEKEKEESAKKEARIDRDSVFELTRGRDLLRTISS